MWLNAVETLGVCHACRASGICNGVASLSTGEHIPCPREQRISASCRQCKSKLRMKRIEEDLRDLTDPAAKQRPTGAQASMRKCDGDEKTCCRSFSVWVLCLYNFQTLQIVQLAASQHSHSLQLRLGTYQTALSKWAGQ